MQQSRKVMVKGILVFVLLCLLGSLNKSVGAISRCYPVPDPKCVCIPIQSGKYILDCNTVGFKAFPDLTPVRLESDPETVLLPGKNLQYLDLDGNQIPTIPGSISELSNLEGLSMQTTQTSVSFEEGIDPFRGLNNLNRLFLSLDNQYIQDKRTNVIPCDNLPELHSFGIGLTNIGSMDQPLAKVIGPSCLKKPEVMSFFRCNLKDESMIGFSTAINTEKPLKLWLRDNFFTSGVFQILAGMSPTDPQPVLGTPLPKLYLLDLSDNDITTVSMPDPEIYFPSLAGLLLSNNQINQISSDWYNLPSLMEISLHGNQLTGKELSALDWKTKVYFGMSLEDNPLDCSCQGEWLVSTVQAQEEGVTDGPFIRESLDMTCASPAEASGKLVSSIELDEDCCQNAAAAQEARLRCFDYGNGMDCSLYLDIMKEEDCIGLEDQ